MARRSTFKGFMLCASTAPCCLVVTAQVGQIGLDHIERARRFATRTRIDQDGGVISIEQSVSKVVTPDAEVGDPNILRGNSRLDKRRATSTPKASSPRKILPIPAIRIRGIAD